MKAVVDYAGNVRYIFLGKSKYSDPASFGTSADLSTKGFYYFLVPCGKCSGCRIDYSRTWAERMIIELKDNPSAVFVTLTYRNEDLVYTDVGEKTLCKRHVQLFFKRLRKAFPDRRIRFYLCGEYGPRTHRPHYHAIIYGLSLSDFFDLRLVGYNDIKQPYWTSDQFTSIWSHGFTQISDVNWHTCAYVARYCLKKFKKEEFTSDVVPEFSLCSRRPGLGMLHAEDYVKSGMSRFAVDGRDGVYDVNIPKAFIRYCKDNKLCLDELSQLCYNREVQAHSRLVSRLLAGDKVFANFLDASARELGRRLAILPERSDFDFGEACEDK